MPIFEAARATAVAPARTTILALALAGCAQGAGTALDRTTLDIAGQPVTVAAPPGFCIDADSTRAGEAGAFVLVSDCALVGGPARAGPPVGAVMTASISAAPFGEGDAGGLSLAGLEHFAGTPEGRAVLGRSGEPGRTSLLASTERAGVLYLYLEDRGTQPVPNVDPRFWRAFFDLGDRLTVLSLLAFADGGPEAQASLDLLAGFADATRSSNPP